MGERSFDDFDEYAAAYRDIHSDNIKISGADSYYFAEMKVRLLAGLEKNEKLNILDVGCGDGATEGFMNEYFPGWEIKAIDISEKSIAEAKSKNVNADFRSYDGLHIPFEDATFDIVFMAGVLHHVSFVLHQNLVKEISRVIKKDGRFYLFEHNPNNPLTRHLVNTCPFDKDARLLKSNYTKKLLSGEFKIESRKFIIFFPRKGILSRLIFLEKYLQWLPLGGQYFFVCRKKS